MDSVKATTLNSKVSAFLHLIPGTTTVHLDSPATHCSNCQQFGHHSTKCPNPATCRWCTIRHSTGDHSCPTATCRVRGRPCSHLTVRCVNCGGPRDAHSPTCPHRPTVPSGESEEEDEEVMMVS